MSTHYLISLFDDTINDVVNPDPTTGESPITGNYVIRVPDEIVVKNPTSVANLLSQKYASKLANHGLFSTIHFDDMLDAADLNAGASSGVCLGTKGCNSLFPGGVMLSTVSNFIWGGPGAGPSQAIITWEVFRYTDADPISGAYTRKYREVSTTLAPIQAEVSFNGGANFIVASDNNLITITAPQQGPNLVVRFTHLATDQLRYWIGSWAVLF